MKSISHRPANHAIDPGPATNKMESGHLAYRADIDGLRAVAVMAVVSYHAFPELMPGGFIGVDTFFVLSGFLISSIILVNLECGRFSFMDFYARRIRRIFPALALVLTATLATGWFLLPTLEYRQQLGAHVAAGAGFISNFLSWSESGYFDNSANTKPLLHLWSLGIEEQFYFVWPLLLAVAWRRGWRFLTVTATIASASFAFNLIAVSENPIAAFYAPHSRFWELMIGGFLAYLATHCPNALPFTRATRSLLGLTMIGLGLVFIDAYSQFPGWWALLPTLGTFLVVSAGPETAPNRYLLGNRVMKRIGLISYPLYLWHWPLLCYVQIASGEPASVTARALAVLVATFLAWFTYVLVERPIRHCGSLNIVAAILSAIVALLMVAGLVVHAKNSFHFNYDWQGGYRLNECFIEATKQEVKATSFANSCDGIETSPRKRPLVLLWGDSHAASLYPGLHGRAVLLNFSLAQYNASACPPVLDYQAPLSANCLEINRFVVGKIRDLRPDMVILAGHWLAYWPTAATPRKGDFDITMLRETVRRLNEIGIKSVAVVGPLPTFTISQPAIGTMTFVANGEARTNLYFNRASIQIDSTFEKTVTQAGAQYISPIGLLCNYAGCLISASLIELVPLAWDYGHLTDIGSALLVDLALRSQALRLPDS